MEKFRVYALFAGLLTVSLILQACGGGGGGSPATGGSTPAGVTLNSIGNKLIAPGASLTFTVSATNPDNHSISFSTDSTHAIYMSQGASFNPATGQFSWTPSVEGSHQVTFSVTNNDVTPAVTDSETITINVSSRVQLNAIGNKSVGPGGTLNFTVSAFNPDNNSVSLSTDSSHAIYTAQGATFNAGTGQFSWTPMALGTHQITFTVTNDDVTPAVTDSETITIDVSNRVQLNAIGNKTVGPNGTLNFTLTASNPDANAISFSTDSVHDIYTSQGATFTPATGEFNWSPTVLGDHLVTFTVTNDDVGVAVSETITISVSNRVQLNPIGNQSVTLGGTLNFTVSASNPDNNSISFSTDTGHIIYTSQNASFTPATGQFSWTPAVTGSHTVSFTVSNNDVSVTDSETISINVQDNSVLLAQGEALYSQHCQSCHGVEGRGGAGTVFGVIGASPEAVRIGLTTGAMSGVNVNSGNEATAIGFYLCDLEPSIDYTNPVQCPP